MDSEPKYRRFSIEERVRWSDTDHARLIFYGSYLRFLEIAEVELLRDAGLPYAQIFDHYGIWLPRVQIHCDFVAPAVLDDLLRVDVFIGRLGHKSIKLNFEVFKLPAGQLLAKAHIIMVCVKREDLQSISIPEEMIEQLRPYAEMIDRS